MTPKRWGFAATARYPSHLAEVMALVRRSLGIDPQHCMLCWSWGHSRHAVGELHEHYRGYRDHHNWRLPKHLSGLLKPYTLQSRGVCSTVASSPQGGHQNLS